VVILAKSDYGSLKILFVQFDFKTGKFVEDIPKQKAIKDMSSLLDIRDVVHISSLIKQSTLYIYYIRKLQNVINEMKINLDRFDVAQTFSLTLIDQRQIPIPFSNVEYNYLNC
jgi:hypothetical protein